MRGGIAAREAPVVDPQAW